MSRWIGDVLGTPAASEELQPTALDGKTLRGTWHRFEGAVHLLAVVDAKTKCVLHQRQVPTDTNEHHVALDVLKDLVLTGRVLTAEHLGWSSVRQLFRITRDVAQIDRVTGERKKSREVVWGITSLSRDQADAKKLLQLHRDHWTIENGVFYIRDEAFGEDRGRVRKRSGPQILAGFRNAALNLLRLSGCQNISANLRSCTWNLQYVKQLLGIVN